MTLKKVATALALLIVPAFSLAQNAAPTSGDVTVRLSEPIDFATARPLQAVRSVVVSSSNPAVPAGSLAVLQLQNRDGSYTLKLLRIAAGGTPFKTMSQPGVSANGSPASGQHASLPDGAVVRFTLTQQDGRPGRPVQQAPPAATTTTAITTPLKGGTTKDRVDFEIEGVKLGMTLPELTEAVKPAGPPKVTHDVNVASAHFKTRDLEFTVMFGKNGALNRMDIFSLAKVKGPNDLADLNHAATHSIMYKRAVEAYGKPDDTSAGDSASWKSPSGTVASYYLQDDTVEIVAK